MNTSITRKLPVDSVTDIADTLVEAVAESVHRVGELVPDHVPTVVSEAVNEGVSRGRQIGREVLDRLPRERRTNRKGWVMLLTALGLASVALVVWRTRSNRQADDAVRDDWSMSDATPRSSGRVA